MTAGHQNERRREPHRALVLEHSFLFRIPPRYAWPAVLSLMAAVAAMEQFAPREIWFGPVYLAVLCLAAWSLNVRIAFMLGTALLMVKLATGHMAFYPMGTGVALSNVAVRFAGIGVVLCFIALARKSCEREWRLARTDLLTGALNRQAFFELVRTGSCSGGWSALIYADLDGLKLLNDQQGHDRGDESLKAFADTVRRTIRDGDVLARMGGDEFVIFMKLRDEDAGQAVARRLHRALNAERPDGSCHLTCSLGVLVLPDGSQSIDAELRAADELMYKAKQSRSGTAVATAFVTDGRIALAMREPAPAHESQVRQCDRGISEQESEHEAEDGAVPDTPRAAA